MRHASGLALLLLFALPLAPLSAQDADPVGVDPAVLADAAVDPAAEAEAAALAPAALAPATPVMRVVEPEAVIPAVKVPLLQDPDLGAIGAGTAEIEDSRLLLETEGSALQPDRRNWWWTVGAIVTAGIILAVVL